jgi:endonuclease V-like protein UPF0215 family
MKQIKCPSKDQNQRITSDKGPKVHKPKSKRKYNLINDEMRSRLVSYIVDEKLNIVTAAEKAGINYENAKAIYRIYRTQGR